MKTYLTKVKMKEDIRAIFRQWCRDEKLIVHVESESLLVNELFNLFKIELGVRT